ncbi:MAG: aminotransferase class I/II-fold pyridoxal phosphate-dependent enzyme [Bacteroidia bacterium]|nr:aminotransferase class I/II-fold pyridoxal phosphate-dependent enzyme [Bacteroidia bacterium]HQU99646.1 aminotransferase class I/II-fold pyridoxal phosphate-dependent enzyme [Bacteroidia bacterium]
MNQSLFNTQLQNMNSRLVVSKSKSKIYLDKNEQSDDVALNYKEKLAALLIQTNWNRYPSNDLSDIEQNVANYCGLTAQNIALSSGSATLITTLLNYFAINRKSIVITQPSYSLFDYHCKSYNIEYTPWMLDDNLNFNLKTLPALHSNSVLIITAPNNPTGTNISMKQLENILKQNPTALIVLDGVYCEFSKTDFTPLINQYENLMVLRSFSKAFPVAGLRLGYLCASATITANVKKLLLQFAINPFTLLFARYILFDAKFMHDSKQCVKNIISERNRMKTYLTSNFSANQIYVYPSEGNFLLIKIKSNHNKLIQSFSHAGIKVLDTSNFVKLNQTVRISIGTTSENNAVMRCIEKAMDLRINNQKTSPANISFTNNFNAIRSYAAVCY